MGKVGKIIVGAALIVTGVVVGVFTGQWTLAFALASTGVGLLTQPRMPKMGDLTAQQGAILDNKIGTLVRLPVVYGTVRIGSVFADIRVDPNSTERKRLVIVPVWCHGSRDGSGIAGVQQLYFNDQLAIDGSTLQTPFSKQVDGQPPNTLYLAYGHHLGTTTDTVDARLNQIFPVEWPITSKGLGVAYSRLELWYANDVYPGGIPTVQAVLAGNHVYDPRDGTWKFSTNPALCVRDYLCSAIYGCGVPESQLDDQSFIDMANHCDEIVSIPGGGSQKRYELNGWVDTDRSVEQNLADLCTSCRGQIVNEGDRWRMIIRRSRTVTGFVISAFNTLEGSWQFILPGNEGAPNVARASYIDPNQGYEVDTVQWPEPGAANSYLTEDNGYEQRLEIDLPYTQNRYTAQQILMTMLKEQRKSIGCICTLTEEAIQCRIGDLVQVTHSTPGWVLKTFDVAALLLGPDASVQAVMIEYDPNSYNLDVQFVQPTPPGKDLPNPFVCAPPTSIVLVSQDQALAQNDGGYVPRIRATWSKAVDPFVNYYQIQARKAASTDSIDPTPVGSYASSAFTGSGLTSFTAASVWNGNTTTDTAISTDSAVAGAWMQLDCGAGITKEFNRIDIFRDTGTYNANWKVQYSDNASSWTDASVGFGLPSVGLNTISWSSVGPHRYWRILLNNTPGAGAWLREVRFAEAAWDDFGRVAGLEAALVYIYPATIEIWEVRVRAVNKIGVQSDWAWASHLVTTPDPRPQILSVTLTNAHSDTHSDIPHQDVAHGDSAHVDSHTDGAHTDHTDHTDAHGDNAGHSDVAHTDSHSDNGQFIGHVDSHSDNAHSDHSDGHSDSHSDSNHLDTAHIDAHTDTTLINPHGDDHTDLAHSDHSDSSFSHTDVAHVDSHTDTAHSDAAHNDSHVDAHSDGQYGVGIAIQADTDSASVKAIARKVSANKVVNGNGETGTVGSQATSWSLDSGNNLVVANDFFKSGSKSLKIVNAAATDSFSHQGIVLVGGKRYRLEGWIKTTALPTADPGAGAVLNVDIASGITSYTIVEKANYDPNTAFVTSAPDLGVAADGVAHDWTFVYCRFIPLASGTINLYLQLGYGGGQSGTAWFDEVGIYEDEPIVADVRTAPGYDGRNVSIELIDAATGAQIQMAPGDVVRVGALAYSQKGATGVEGPLALATVGLFNVAPVGTNMWVPA